jgi:hypothetical protein
MIKAGLWTKRVRHPKHRYWRKPKDYPGELVYLMSFTLTKARFLRRLYAIMVISLHGGFLSDFKKNNPCALGWDF